jgi:hypothetical protein
VLPDEVLSELIEDGCIAIVGEKDKGNKITEEVWTKTFCDTRHSELKKWVDVWSFWEHLSPFRQVKSEVAFYSAYDTTKKGEVKTYITQKADELKVAKTNMKVWEQVKTKFNMESLS